MRKLAILVVDREAPAEALAAALRRHGHRVRTAHPASLANCAEEHCDVVVLALEPAEGALEASLAGLRELRARHAALRAIVVGPAGDFELCRAALRAGADDYLERPLRSQALAQVLARIAAAGEPEESRFASPEDELVLELFSSPEAIELSARACASFALAHGLGPATRARIASAVAECVENACVHAYPVEPGTVRVRLSVKGPEAQAVIEDDGVGFDAPEIGEDCFESPLHNGLARVCCLAEDVDVDSRPGAGTVVRLRFALYRIALGEEGDLDLSERDHLTPEDAREVLHQVQALERGDELVLSPALAVVVGRLLAGPDLRRRVELALRS